MPNILIQKTIENYDFTKDKTFEKLDHYNYKHNYFCNLNLRIDLFDYDFSKQNNFYEDETYIIGIVGYVLFKNDIHDSCKQILDIIKKNENIIDYIDSGKFVIVIYNKEKNKLEIVNDRFGLYPIYYYEKNNNIILSTEPKGIIYSKNSDTFKLDFLAIKEFLTFNYTIGNKYFLKEIKRLEPATHIIIKKNHFKKINYHKESWKFEKNKANKKDLKKLQKLFVQGLDKIETKYNIKTILPISGGYDSRYIFFNDKKIKNVLTFDKKSIQYKIVLDTLKTKQAKLFTLETEYNKNTIDEIKEQFLIGDGLFDLQNTQNLRMSNFIKKKQFEGQHDGFAGDAILGGTYLNYKKEFFREFGMPLKYSRSDFPFSKQNNCLFHKDFLNKINKEKINIDSKYYTKTRDIRKNLILFKWYNRGLNWLSLGASIQNKQIHNIFPFFYYPFFDEYTKYSLDLLRCKKLYTKLYKILPKKYQNLTDNFHIIKFKWPFKIRLIYSFLNQVLLKLNIIHQQDITDYKTQFKECDELIHFAKTTLLESDMTDKKEITKIFQDKQLIKKNQDQIYRTLNIVLFLEKYKQKIKY